MSTNNIICTSGEARVHNINIIMAACLKPQFGFAELILIELSLNINLLGSYKETAGIDMQKVSFYFCTHFFVAIIVDDH